MSYLGPPLAVGEFFTALYVAAREAGFAVEEYGRAHGWPLLALRKSARAVSAPSLYLSAGIHGDEPAGPLALLQLLRDGYFDSEHHWLLFPALNPGGLAAKIRTNPEGFDVNRDYGAFATQEASHHTRFLDAELAAGYGRYDLCLCLHEDWESKGFYLYELNRMDGPLLGRAALAAVESICGIDHSSIIEELPAQHGLITVPWSEIEMRPEKHEALYLGFEHTKRLLTFESPSAQSLNVRIAALAAATKATIEGWARGSAAIS